MTAPLRELFANRASTTLNGSISDSATSIVVTDGSVFPTTGNFRVTIESEIILVTARSTNTLTGVRAQEGTLAVSHDDLVPVKLQVTEGSLATWGKDNVALWGYHLPYKIVNDAGTALLVASDFTWQNQEGASVTDQAGTILMRLPTNAGIDLRSQTRTAPATPYAYIAAFHACMPRGGSDDSCQIAFGFREAATAEATFLRIGTSSDEANRIAIQNYVNNTTVGTFPRAVQCIGLRSNALWLRIEDNGTNLIYSVGMDGLNWIQLLSQSRTTIFATGPDQVFWGGINNENTVFETLVRLLHWSRE